MKWSLNTRSVVHYAPQAKSLTGTRPSYEPFRYGRVSPYVTEMKDIGELEEIKENIQDLNQNLVGVL